MKKAKTFCREFELFSGLFRNGAAHSLVFSDTVSEIGIKFNNGDKLVKSFSIGGDEYSFRKQVNEMHRMKINLAHPNNN